MSLTVEPYFRDSRGYVAVQHEGGSQSHKLAGSESCRADFYGSAAAISLGLSLLPSLRTTDLYAEGDDLARLEQEVQTLLQRAEFVSEQTRFGVDFIQEKSHNILAAIRRARELGPGGGVVIS
jgi:hypothetical protein